MALTVTTDLTVITSAEEATNALWNAVGTQSAAVEPDFFVQGAQCFSRAVSNSTKGMVYDNTTGIDFTTGTHKDKLVYIWMRVNTPQLVDTRTAGGVVVRLCTTSATSNFREWYVDGKDTLPEIDGWICYVIDPQSAGNNTSGSYSAASVRYFGGVIKTTTSAKGQNLGIDQISYGRGELYVSGTVTTAGEGFKEITAVAFDSAKTNRWGIITIKSGIFYVKGKIIIGHATADTTFSSRGEVVIFETPSYKETTNVVKAIPDASVGGTTGADGKTTYLGIGFIGGSGATAIDFGVIVGTDSGRSGPTFKVAENAGLTTPGRTLATVTASNDAMALSQYATNYIGFEGAINLGGTNTAGDDAYVTNFNGCGNITANVELDNSFVLSPVVVANTSAVIWNDNTDPDGLLDNSTFTKGTTDHHAIEFGTGSPISLTLRGLNFSGFNASQDVNASIFHIKRTSGTVTINLVGCSSDVAFTNSYRTDGATVVIVLDPVTLQLTVQNTAGTKIQNARALVTAGIGGAFPSDVTVTITTVTTTASVAHTAHGMANGDKVLITGANENELNGIQTISNVTTNAYDYTITSIGGASGTGTIKSSFVIISGLTDVNGIISDTRTYSASTPLGADSKVRKSSGSPYYKTGPVVGTVSSTAGASITVILLDDE
jgi:hypothetical protein